jgi:hypothetical protein
LDLVGHRFKDIDNSVGILANPGRCITQVSHQGSAVDDPQSIEKRIGFSRIHKSGYQRFVTKRDVTAGEFDREFKTTNLLQHA